MLPRRAVLAGFAAMLAPTAGYGGQSVSAAGTTGYSRRAVSLMHQAMVIDMLSPLHIAGDPTPILSRPVSDQLRADYQRSGLTAINNAVGFAGPGQRLQVMDFLLSWSGFVGRNSDVFQLVGTVADIDRAKLDGKVAVIMGTQNSEHFERPEDVRHFHALGQRVSQLTYNTQNLIGSGSTDRVDGGLSDFGVGIVKAMNDVGMLVDISHCGDRTSLDAIEMASGAIAITHSNVRALNNGHPRCKPDEVIRACARKGGVMGITNMRMFLNASDPTSVDTVVDHIAHVAKLVGVEHVGLGSDQGLYGYDTLPPAIVQGMKAGYKSSYGFRDKLDADGTSQPQRYLEITEALIRRGFGDQDILGILGGNFRRLLLQTWT